MSDAPAQAPAWLPIGPGTVLGEPGDPPLQPSAAPSAPRAERVWTSVLPGLAIAVSIMISFAVINLAVSPRAAFDTYLPTDGAVSTVTDDAGQQAQLEQGVIRPTALTELGPTGAAVAQGMDSTTATGTRFLRATMNPSPDGVRQVWFGADADGLALSLVSSPTVAFALVPGIQVATAGGSPPGEQAGTVTVWDTATRSPVRTGYRAEVDSTGDDCAELTIMIDALTRIDVTATLCRAIGITAFSATVADERISFTPAADRALPGYSGTAAIPTRPWSSHAAWKPTTQQPYGVDAFGPSKIIRSLQARPTVLDDGTLIVASATTSDLEAYTPSPDGLQLAWRAHPGGSVVAVTAVGQLTVAALASGDLVAYDDTGLRAWANDTITETIAGQLLPLTDAVSFATLDGFVWRVDTHTGVVAWSKKTASAINKAVVGDDRFVQAVDTTGGVYGWVPSGQQVFNGQVAEPFDFVAVDEVNSYLIRGITMEAYELQRSVFQWGVAAPQSPNDVCTTSAGLVVATDRQTVGVAAATGATAWRAGGAVEVRCGTAAVVAVNDRTVTVLAADGRRTLTLQTPVAVRNLSVSGIATSSESVYVVLPQTVIRLGG